MRGYIARAWSSYFLDVVPDGAPDVQVVECKRAFYAGARAAFNGLVSTGISGDSSIGAPLDERERAIQAELLKFKADVEAGTA